MVGSIERSRGFDKEEKTKGNDKEKKRGGEGEGERNV